MLKECEANLNKINSASKGNDDSIAKGNDIKAALARYNIIIIIIIIIIISLKVAVTREGSFARYN
jgi:hypothetical protein